MKKSVSLLLIFVLIAALFVGTAAYADDAAPAAEEAVEEVVEESSASLLSTKAWAACAVIGLVAAAGAISMGCSICKSVDSISRQPETAGEIRTSLMLGLVFVETAIIYALIIAILVIFVL